MAEIRQLIDKQLSQRLLKRMKEARLEEKELNEDKLIFGFTYQNFYLAVREAILKLELKNKDIHSTRHTFATWLTRICEGNRQISEEVLGHSSSEINKRYVHLAEELEISVRNQEASEIDEDLVPIKIG